MPDLIILSPCFYPDGSPAELMVKSARHHGLQVLLYGINQQFIPHGAHAQVLKLWELMTAGKLADYVMVTDCRDTLLLAPEKKILERFLSKIGRTILMSTETGCWPPEPEIAQHFYPAYINAGQYMGKWEEVIAALRLLLDKYRGIHPGADNSQGWWMWAKMRNEIEFDLDVQREVFYSMSGDMDLHLYQYDPCSVHFNGNPSVREPHAEMYRRLFA